MKNRAFKKLTAILLALILIVSSAPITTFAAQSQLQQDDSDGYYVYMPASDSDTLDLTNKRNGFSFNVYDNGGADANYSDSCDGTLLITAPENFIIRVSGSGQTENGYDWLYLYDGDTSTELGSGKYQGSFTVDEVSTSGNVLKLFFHSDSSKNFSGIDLTVTLVDLATLVTLSFSAGDGSGTMNSISVDPGTEITVPECAFTAPEDKLFLRYTDGENNYQPGDNVTLNANMTLTAVYVNKRTVTYEYGGDAQTADIAQGSEINLPTFASLFTLPERKTFKYWLGGETHYAEGDSFTVTEDTTFTAVLEDDPVILHSETYANYALVPKGINVTADLSGENEGYQLRVFDDGGADGNYSNNADGSITVLAPEGCLLGVSGNIVTESNYDYLWLYDGSTTDATQLYKDSGTKTVENVYTSGNALTIRFTSDGSSVKTGLDLTVTVVGSSSTVVLSYDAGEGSGTINSVTVMPGTELTVPECTFTAPEGKRFLHFTDGENSYQPGNTITVNDNVTLTAIYINEYTVTYAYDTQTKSVIVAQGTEIELPAFATVLTPPERKTFQYWLCGETHYAEGDSFTVTENTTFTAVFTDDPVILHNDTYENYALLPKGINVTADLSDKAVGYELRVFDDGGADGDYSNNCDGSIKIIAPEGCLLGVSGNIDTESGYDYLWIYDGATTDAAQLYKDSAAKTISPINTTGTALVIRFTSDGSKNYSGLDLTVTILDQSMLATLSFDAGEGSGTIDDISVNPGAEVTVPECAFTEPEGKRFSHYSDGENNYQPGDVITLNDDMTLTAIYINEYTVTYECRGAIQTVSLTEGTEISLPVFETVFTLPERHSFSGWQSNDSVYNEGDSYTVNSDTTFTAVLTEDPVVLHDDTLGYYAEMPKTVTVTADLSDKEDGFVLHVYDDGGAEGEYSNGCDGTMLITAPENFILQISGSGETENYNDYLRIYDGSGSVVLGEERYTDTFTFDTLSTSGNVLMLVFRTDISRVYSGLDLTVTVKDPSTLATISFLAGDGSGSMNNISVAPGTEVTVPECSFIAPEGKIFTGYTDGENDYKPGDVITLSGNKTLTAVYTAQYTVTYSYDGSTETVTLAEGTQITLPTFTSLFTLPERHSFKGWQCVGTVYDEGDLYTVTQDSVFAAIVTEDAVIQQDDEDNYYTNMSTSGTLTADLSDRDEGFVLHVYDNGGADANYSNYCDGYLRIVAPEDCVLLISGSGVSEPRRDYLYIYDGDTNTAVKTYQSVFTVSDLLSSGNILKLRFTSDYGTTYSGLDLTVTVVARSTLATLSFSAGEGSGAIDSVTVMPGTEVTVPECTFTIPEGKLFSCYTDGENDYQPGDVITLNESKTLTAVYVDKSTLTYVFGEETQTVDVVKDTEITLPTFTSMFTLPDRKLFTGWQRRGTIYNEGDSFAVTEDITFTAVLEDEPVILHDDTYENYALLPKSVNVTADLTGEDDGYLLWIFDNGGVNGYYSANCDGSVTVLCPEGCIMQISGDVSTESGCDYLYVYDGDSSDAELLGKFSGSSGTGKMYTTGTAVTIRFTSDGGVNRRGVDVKVTVTRPESLVTVSFDPGEGSGSMDDIVLLPGDQIYVPYNGFTVPEGYLFNYFTDGTKTYKEHDLITVTQDLHLTAVYVEKITITYQYGEATYVNTYKKGAQYSVRSFGAAGFTLPYRKSFKCWLNGETEVNASVWLYATEDITYTPVLTDLPYLIDDGSGGFYALMPEVEDVTLDLSDKANGFTFKLYDNGGENNYYSNECDGSLTFTAPEGYIFFISGSVNSEANLDVFSIYDSDLTTLLGGQSYSGKSEISELCSSSNTVKMAFVSDSTSTNPGFALTVRMIDVSTLISVTFDAGEGSGTMDSLTQIAGEAFTLPDYGFTAPSGKIFNGYSDGTNTYMPGESVSFDADTTLTAQWVDATGITYSYNDNDQAVRYAKGSTVILPEFTTLFTLPSGMHFVGWQEKFSGDMYNEGDSYVVNDPTVFTAVLEILYSDGNGGYYTLMPVNNPYENLTLDLSDKQNGFSFTLYDDGGADNNYANDNDGVLIVKAPDNMVVSVTGSGQTESGYDYLIFYDGASSSDSVIGSSKYSGNINITEPVESTGNYMRIYFHSDYAANYSGFALTVSVAAKVSVNYVFGDETKSVAAQKDSTIELADFDTLFTSYDKEFICWQNGEDNYDEGDEYYVSGDVTFTAVTRLMPVITLDGNGAAVLGGDGETTAQLPVPTGSAQTFPSASLIFEIPDGKYFGGWQIDGVTYNIGDEYTVTGDVTVTALWREANAWDELNESLNVSSGTDLGTITMTEDLTAAIGSLPLTVPAGVTATIDLNGHALDGTNAAAVDGNAIIVNGSLTITDSGENGSVTGGSITTFESGVFTPSDAVSSCFEAMLTQSYVVEDNDTDERTDHTYSVSYCPTFESAMTAAALEHNYKDSITTLPADPDSYYFWYNDSKVALLRDVTIDEGEALTVNSDDSIWLDLNGHTFDNQGTFNGGVQGWRYSNGDYVQTFYPTYIQIVSENTTGVFRSSGTIDVNLQPWTEDTYYFTGGTVNGFVGADGGNFHISGGHFTNIVMFNNGNENANLEIELSGDAEFDRLEHMIYANDEGPAIHMTISDNVRVGAMLFDIMGDGVVNYPVLTINGGYFAVDPSAWKNTAGAGENSVQITGDVEQYDGQEDWSADSDTYTWRVKTATVYTTQNGTKIDLAETFTRNADDTADFGISDPFKNFEILGIQKKATASDEKRSMRFVAVMNDEILKDAEDYGFIAVKGDNLADARANIEGVTLDSAKNVFSCKGTDNTVSGDYGTHDSDTGYKYVTFGINNIGDYGVAVKFYVKDKSGNVFYADYTNKNNETFDNCSADWAAINA